VDRLSAGTCRLDDRASRLGVFGMTNADEVMLAPLASWTRHTGTSHFVSQLLLGDEIRDWSTSGDTYSFFPYTEDLQLVSLDDVGPLARWLWPSRTTMGNRATFSKGTYFTDGRPWYEWHQLTADPDGHRWFIPFAFVATHNHFVLDRGGKVFKQSAPVIKLPEGAGEWRLRELAEKAGFPCGLWTSLRSPFLELPELQKPELVVAPSAATPTTTLTPTASRTPTAPEVAAPKKQKPQQPNKQPVATDH